MAVVVVGMSSNLAENVHNQAKNKYTTNDFFSTERTRYHAKSGGCWHARGVRWRSYVGILCLVPSMYWITYIFEEVLGSRALACQQVYQVPGTTLIENPGAPIHRSIAIFDDFLGFAHLWIFLDCSQNVKMSTGKEWTRLKLVFLGLFLGL